MHDKNKSIMVLCAVLYALPAVAGDAPPLHRLKEKEIRANVVGKVVTDETHWSDYYLKDGTVKMLSMGTEEAGKWLIKKDELCISSKSTNECYEVWQSGNQVELRLEGTGYPYVGVIKPHSGD